MDGVNPDVGVDWVDAGTAVDGVGTGAGVDELDAGSCGIAIGAGLGVNVGIGGAPLGVSKAALLLKPSTMYLMLGDACWRGGLTTTGSC